MPVHYSSYSFDQTADATQFFFESIGLKGFIQKTVIFSSIDDSTIYNLALGDIHPETNEMDDQAVSDNGDTAAILTTVFHITYRFLSVHPDFIVLFRGNSDARNRLYRMAINRATEELLAYFDVFGYCYGAWEIFNYNRPYESFLIRKK